MVVTGSGKRLKRPYRMIYPLEAGDIADELSHSTVSSAETNPASSHTNSTEYLRGRSSRAAAQTARDRLRSLCDSESDSSDDE